LVFVARAMEVFRTWTACLVAFAWTQLCRLSPDLIGTGVARQVLTSESSWPLLINWSLSAATVSRQRIGWRSWAPWRSSDSVQGMYGSGRQLASLIVPAATSCGASVTAIYLAIALAGWPPLFLGSIHFTAPLNRPDGMC